MKTKAKAQQWEYPMAAIKPNPYRGIRKYPIDRSRVDDLKSSMENTGVWPNIIGRNGNGDTVQIAYGHHRWIAAKELGYDTMIITILPLTDSEMIHIMANENMTSWSHSVKVVNQTMRSVKRFLDKEFRKAKKVKDLDERLLKIVTVNWRTGETTAIRDYSDKAYQTLRSKGVGAYTILGFLGSPWKRWMIQGALENLDLIDEGYIEEKTLSEASSMGAAKEIGKIAKGLEKQGLSKSAIKKKMNEVVKVANEEDVGRRGLQEAKTAVVYGGDPVKVIKREARERAKKKKEKVRGAKPIPTIDKFVLEALANLDVAKASVFKLLGQTENIEGRLTKKQWKGGVDRILEVLVKMHIELNGVEGFKKLTESILPKQLK